MQRFTTLTSRLVAIQAENIDTDQIIPARFLKTTSKEGLGNHLFADWRYDANGAPIADFSLNGRGAQDAKILLAGRNFGCGSSREHAPWALTDFGFRVVISTSFADIFRSNALKNSLLTVIVDDETHRQLFSLVQEQRDIEVTVDLEAQTLRLPDGRQVTFPIDGFGKTCMLEGLDQLDYLLNQEPQIMAFEQSHPARVDTAIR